MGLIHAVDLLNRLAPPYEVQSEDYYEFHLTRPDNYKLREFVWGLGNGLAEGVPSAVIAVGSSAFPDAYWERLKDILPEDVYDDVPKHYNDINLLVVPNGPCYLDGFSNRVQETLFAMRYKFEPHKDTPFKGKFEQSHDGSFSRTQDPGKGIHSISTRLKNGTGIELILGKENAFTANKAIDQLKADCAPFSVLYHFGKRNFIYSL